MAGIYIHVPFCKKKCLYCDFYSIGNRKGYDEYIDAINREIELRKGFIGNELLETIYFGGGTPSLLPANYIDKIVKSIHRNFDISKVSEITLEANPDDIYEELLIGYREAGVNRLSIGIQSFNDSELQLLGRRHNAISSINSVAIARKVGFDNISIDLIYGLPGSTIGSWEYSLQKAFSLNVEHISCYHLTYEEGTPIFRKLKENQIDEVDEALSVSQFDLLRKIAIENNFVHYEVSNFAREGFFSKHNTSYWKGIPYLGVGPAAHSYNGETRQWNPKSYTEWVSGINTGKPSVDGEQIDNVTKFNEVLLTHLRTIWGVDLDFLKKEFGESMVEMLLQNCTTYLDSKKLTLSNSKLKIPQEYFIVSDGIISDLLIVD